MWLCRLEPVFKRCFCHDPVYCNGHSATKFLKRDRSKTYGLKGFFFGGERKLKITDRKRVVYSRSEGT